VGRRKLGADLWALLGQHGHQLDVHLLQRDRGTVDERGGTELAGAKAATTDQQRSGSDPASGTNFGGSRAGSSRRRCISR